MPLSLINPITEASTIATNVVNNSAQTNYIAFPVATSDPTSNGWRVYKDTDTVLPVDGEGGSPVITLTRNTDTPLNSTGDFRLTKSSGASRRGEGFSTDFTIAPRHLGKVLQISFDYEVISGSSLATDDLRIYIIQEPASVNRVVIEPVSVSVQGTVSGNRIRHLATFQTHISITSYRLCVHVATTTNSTQVIDFNNFRVWESTQSVGSITTDWQSYVLTSSNTQNIGTPYASPSQNVRWRRVGSNLEMMGNFRVGTVVSAELRINFPNGLVANITPTTDRNDPQIIGYGFREASVTNSQASLHTKNGFNYFNMGVITTASNNNPLTALNGTNVFSNDEDFTFHLSVPIQGWGSSVSMSSDSNEGRVVSGKYTTITSLTINATTTLKYSTLVKDTHSAYNPSTGVLKIPVAGDYMLNLAEFLNTSGTVRLRVYINGVLSTNHILGVVTASEYGNLSVLITDLRAGDDVDIRGEGTINIANTSGSTFSWHRVSAGSQVIATTENVYLRYRCTNGQTISNSVNTDIQYNDRVYDSHGAYNTSNYRFTAPMSGTYLITASILPSTNSANGFSILAFVNTTSTSTGDSVGVANIYGNTGVFGGTVGSLTLRLNAGDYVRFTGFSSVTATTLVAISPNFYSTLTITRLGI